MGKEVYLLLGSNLGDRMQNMKRAIDLIGLKNTINQTSSVYRTAAWGNTDQPDFYNQVICIFTEFSPSALLASVLDIEQLLGRVRNERWGARTVDIDILFYGDAVLKQPDLTIPHPGIPVRRFTLVPLEEIASTLIHPVYQRTIAELLSSCDDPLPVEKVE